MFNDLRVSNSISSQVPKYFSQEYPNFVNFLKDYYRFLETNGNSLDLLNGIQDLIDIETYTGIDYSAILTESVDLDDTEIVVNGHVNYPLTNGLLKINDEVIFYRLLEPDVLNGNKVTKFTDCIRGYTYNTLTIEEGFKSNIKTTPSAHDTGATVENQSYVYLLYFLEQLREQYLSDFPKGILEKNLEKGLNINNLLKKIKDFYLSKGTPKGIEFYFKFLFQQNSEIRNYRDSIFTPSDAVYEDKVVVRLENLDSYSVSDIILKEFVQKEETFTVLSFESLYSNKTLALEYEISNSNKLLPTKFTKIITEPNLEKKYLYVESTEGFPESGSLRYRDLYIKYTSKQSNYFICDDSINSISTFFGGNISKSIGQTVYDVETLCTIKDAPEFYFAVYTGIVEVTSTKNIGYIPGDVGTVTEFTLLEDPILTSWVYNDILPARRNSHFLASVTNLYYSDDSVFLTVSKLPFAKYPGEGSPTVPDIDLGHKNILMTDRFVRIPRNFNQRILENREDTIRQFPVGLLIDGTPLLNWKNNNTITRGELSAIDIQNGGSEFNINSPPIIKVSNPTTTEDGRQTAELELKVSGSITEVNIESGGTLYPSNTSIIVEKSVDNDPNVTFREAVLSCIVVNGEITRVKIIDPGTGYTAPPTIVISSTVGTDAVISAVVEGSIYKVDYKLDDNGNPIKGKKYTQNPVYQLQKGSGCTALPTVSNGKLTNITLINPGKDYNSPPRVNIIDDSGAGIGAKVISKIDSNKKVIEFVIVNSGINYNFNSTRVVVEESGAGDVINLTAQIWTPVNNYFQTIKGEDGSFYELIDSDNQIYTYNTLGTPLHLKHYDKVSGQYLDVDFIGDGNGKPHSPIIGWAFDGAPIYGPFGFREALDSGSDIVRMTSGYRKKLVFDDIREQVGGIGLNEFEKGYFAEDWEWIPDPSNLDRENGRFCVTPEFPDGVYAYFATIEPDGPDKNKAGFPYFVGSQYKGSTFNEFNAKETRILLEENLTKFVSLRDTISVRPIDPGLFTVSSIPESTDSKLSSISVDSGGDLYKFGDKLVFDNSQTNGFGATAIVSVLNGRSISNTSKQTYDYIEYDQETATITESTIFKTVDGFIGNVFNVDLDKKQIYITKTAGSAIPEGAQIFDDQNLTDAFEEEKLSATLNSNLFTTVLSSSITATDSLIDVNSVTNIDEGDFIKIGEEYLKVIRKTGTELFVIRGVNGTRKQSYTSGTSVKILNEITLFSSIQFVTGDVVKIDSELFKIVDIKIDRLPNIQGIDIVDGGSSIPAGTYFLYFDGELQVTGGNNVGTVTIANGSVTGLTFDSNNTNIFDNPNIQIGDSSTYSAANFLDVDIRGSRYLHTIVAERTLFGSTAAPHSFGTRVIKQNFTSAVVKKYEEGRILTTIGANDNLLIPGDDITISASLNSQEEKEITVSNGAILIDGVSVSELELYEGYSYTFVTPDIRFDFYGISTENNNKIPGKKYFDIDVKEEYTAQNALSKFIIEPKASDLTEYFLVLIDTTTQSSQITKNILVKTISEPINGEYKVLKSSATDFVIYTEDDPQTNFISNYNSNTISYTTTSKNAKGPINFVTLTSGGFSYITPPGISNIISDEGVGAILSPKTNSIGLITNINNNFSGYGFNSDFRQKPIVQFPQILTVGSIFTVSSISLTSGGSNYLFTPRVVVTGGGLADGDPSHAIINAEFAKTGSRNILDLNIEFSGQKYTSAPDINIEKYYFIEIDGSGNLKFKFPFNQYILQNDKFKIRGYYLDNTDQEKFAESDVFFANLQTTSITCRETAASTTDVDPRLSGDLGSVTENILRYEFISESRVATATAIVVESTFLPAEKIIFNVEDGIEKFGFVATNLGWQPSNATLRVEKFNYQFKIGDTISGETSNSFGVIQSVDGSVSTGKLGVKVTKPKKFLTKNSFLGSNFEKIQDSFKYQRFAYEIGVETPLSEWKENYKQTVHPTGYNLFARATIDNKVDVNTKTSSISVISTTIAKEVSFRRKYNYLSTRNVGIEEVDVLNRRLTDIKETEQAVVAVFEDFSEEFNGVNTSFVLKVVNPLDPTNFETGEPNYIEDYDVDQMIVILDNVIQTYGTSWFVTESDKNIRFISSQLDEELLPEGELLVYRKLNDDLTILEYSETISAAGSTFAIRDLDGNPWTSAIFNTIDEDNYFVFVDGICQSNSAFTISNTNSGQIDFGSDVLPIGTELSVRYVSDLLKNEFSSGSVTANTPVTLSNTPTVATSKDSYFVFVDGVLMTSGTGSIYDIDVNKNIIFTVSFNYDSLIVIIDSKGVSLPTQEDDITAEKYSYKIEDGQVDIPVGMVMNAKEYIVDIAGVVQTPNIVYTVNFSGQRKINFTEPPERILVEENDPNINTDDVFVGRQFVGLLYQRSDPSGTLTSDPRNYQFDDISQNIIHVRENLDNFIIGDVISKNNDESFALITNKKTVVTKVETQNAFVNSNFLDGNTGTLILNTIKNIFVGDRFEFNSSLGLTSSDDDEIEITSINRSTNTITFENVSGSTLSINIPANTLINFKHNTLEISNLETTVANRDEAFVDNDIILSGTGSIQSTNVNSSIDNAFGLRLDTAIANVQASNVSGGGLTGNANIVNGGVLYAASPLPEIKIIGGSGSGATATPTIAGGVITQIALSGGTGYDSANLPNLVIDGPPSSIIEVPTGDGASFANGDYILINESEVVQITNISSDDLTVDRGQLLTDVNDFYIKTTPIRKVIPYQVTCKSFRRGFDGNKTVFELTEQFQSVDIAIDSDIFVILNGVQQELGPSKSYTLSQTGTAPNIKTLVNFTEAPKFGSPCNVFYLGQTISINDISNQFNGSRRVFELRDNLGEIFSFSAKGKPDANISANLILFIDGVYQIPSVSSPGRTPAYPDSLASYKLFGSLIEFSSPPRNGAEFSGFIYVGADSDYINIDIDPPVESGDIIIQDNEVRPRIVTNVISSNTLAATDKSALTEPPGYQFTDLIQLQPVRESLRARRLISSTIATGGLTGFPLTGKVASTSAYNVEIEPIEDFIPAVPDPGNREFTFKLASSANFPERYVNSTYTTASFGATSTDNDTLQGVIIGYDLPFNNIIHLLDGAPTIFDNYTYGDVVAKIARITYGPSTYDEFGADVIKWEPDNDNVGGKLYLKLDDTSNPPLTTHKIKIITIGTTFKYENNRRYSRNQLVRTETNIYKVVNGRTGSTGEDGVSSEEGNGPSGTGQNIQDGTVRFDFVESLGPLTNTFDIDDDDLIAEYQSLTVGDSFYYTT